MLNARLPCLIFNMVHVFITLFSTFIDYIVPVCHSILCYMLLLCLYLIPNQLCYLNYTICYETTAANFIHKSRIISVQNLFPAMPAARIRSILASLFVSIRSVASLL